MNNENGKQQPSTWLTRLCQEASDLKERLGKLDAFLENYWTDPSSAPPIDVMDLALLIAQSGAMRAYLELLEHRLSRASAKAKKGDA